MLLTFIIQTNNLSLSQLQLRFILCHLTLVWTTGYHGCFMLFWNYANKQNLGNFYYLHSAKQKIMIEKQINSEQGQLTGGRRKGTHQKVQIQLQGRNSRAPSRSFCSYGYSVAWTGLWKKNRWFDWDFKEVFMCLYSHWQLKANIYMSHCFLHPLFIFRYKGNLSCHSCSHYQKFYESPVLQFCCFLAEIIWPRSLGSVSAISHEGTLKPLKQSFEDFSGRKELPALALCRPALGTAELIGANGGTRKGILHNFSLLQRVGGGREGKVESCCTSKARKTGDFLHMHSNTLYMKSTHQKCLFLQ